MLGPWWTLGLFFLFLAFSMIGVSIKGLVDKDNTVFIIGFVLTIILIGAGFFVADFDVTYNEDYRNAYIDGTENLNETYYINCVEYIEIAESKRALIIIDDKPIYRRCKGYIDGYEETLDKINLKNAKSNLSINH